MRHGTRYGYRCGCRCDACRARQTAYMDGYRTQRRTRTADIPHGTRGGYDNASCRCEACRAAKSQANREYQATRRARAEAVR